MTTSLKKLLLVSVTLILGVMSSRVMATPTTNYDFTTLSSGPTVSGSAVSSDGTVYTSLNNVMFGSNSIASGDIYFIGSGISNYGFLLGCLFLMFGRKKQNSEPMMTT